MNKQERLDINRTAWDAYQADYMRFNLKERPDFFERLGMRNLKSMTARPDNRRRASIVTKSQIRRAFNS